MSLREITDTKSAQRGKVVPLRLGEGCREMAAIMEIQMLLRRLEVKVAQSQNSLPLKSLKGTAEMGHFHIKEAWGSGQS